MQETALHLVELHFILVVRSKKEGKSSDAEKHLKKAESYSEKYSEEAATIGLIAFYVYRFLSIFCHEILFTST